MSVWDYIVLGQIPGTSVQINFIGWLFIVAGLTLGLGIVQAVRSALRFNPKADGITSNTVAEILATSEVQQRQRTKRASLNSTFLLVSIWLRFTAANRRRMRA